MREFVHIHNHTHYSLLDAICTVDDLIDLAIKDNQRAVALTDHGVMFGCMSFYEKAKKKGIKPLVGMEAYIANGSRFDKKDKSSVTKKKNYFHVLLLAKNEIGYINLMKLTSIAHVEGLYYKPRIDRELIQKYSEGLICSSACLGGVVSSHIVSNDYEAAREATKFYKDVFGDDFYLEIQNHGLQFDPAILSVVPKLAKEFDVKLVATNDIHYPLKKNAVAHNLLLNIRDATSTNSGSFELNQLRYGTAEYHFKSQAEMNELFKEFPEALDSTIEIAEKCNLELKLGDNKMPVFPIPVESKAQNLDDYMLEVAKIGLKQRFPEVTEEIQKRFDYEMSVIIKMQFAGYFLIVWDFIRAAREMGIRVGPGRGSAAGSLVAYALKITDVNPLEYNLLFERFLNPDRISMPDIDVDFSDNRREEVIQYVKKKYGEKAVAMIITFNKMTSKAVLSDVGRVLGISLSRVKEVTKHIPTVFGKVTKLTEAIDTINELKSLKNPDDPLEKEWIEYSIALEDKNRSAGTHAAGVVIAPGDITDYVPIYKPSKIKEGSSVEIASQYNMKDLELAGLIKMDFLGLSTLSIIDDTLEMIKQNHNLDVDIDAIDYSDQKVFDLISEGNTLSIFQFESGGMRDYLKRLKPISIEELSAMNALFRPGPMENIPLFIDRKFGRVPIEYLHPDMKDALEYTYGIIVYQEQIMLLAVQIAGWTLAQADELRKVMGKKDLVKMAQMRPKFIKSIVDRGYEEKFASELTDLIEKFANYGFNKSHAVAYSILAYQTAWLKTYYPAEFIAANMSAEINDQDQIVALIEEARKFNIMVAPPDINKSIAKFYTQNNTIYFGLTAVKNVGAGAVDVIVRARQEGNFKSFFEFCSRVDKNILNKRTLEALICSGAFDSLKKGHRNQFLDAIDLGLEYAKKIEESKNSTMDSLFLGNADTSLNELTEPQLNNLPEWEENFRLAREKEFLNFYVSGHPLFKYEAFINSFSSINSNFDISTITKSTEKKYGKDIGKEVRICGLMSEIIVKKDQNKNSFAIVTLEDFNGKVECLCFSKTYPKVEQELIKGAIVLITGKVNPNEENLKVFVEDIIPINNAISKFSKGYKLWLDISDSELNSKIEKFYSTLCVSLYGKSTLQFNLLDKTKNQKIKYEAYEVNIDLNEKTFFDAVKIFGNKNIAFIN